MKKTAVLILLLISAGFAEFQTSFDEAYQGLTSNSVIEVAYDSSGIWLGTSGGASFLADGDMQWLTFRGNSGLSTDLVSALAAAKYGDTTFVIAASIHTEDYAGQSNEWGDGYAITIDHGETWDIMQPPGANWIGMLSWDIDIYQDDIYSANWYGGLIRLKAAGSHLDQPDSIQNLAWENLYLNTSDSLDLWVDSTFYNLTNYYFSVKIDTTLAPDTISLFAGTALGVNRYIFEDYDYNIEYNLKQDASVNFAYNSSDPENSLPGNFVVAMASNGTPGRIYDADKSGDYVYIAHDFEGLWVTSASDLTSQLGNADTPGRAWGIDVVGNYAYVADYEGGLQIIDISVPSSPTVTGSYQTTGHAVNVHVDGTMAYVCDDIQGIKIIDVSDPSNPQPAFTDDYDDFGYGAKDVYVQGDYAFGAFGFGGVNVYDLTIAPDSSAAEFALVARFTELDEAVNISVDDSLVYVADAGEGLYALNFANDDTLILVNYISTSGEAQAVGYNDDYAFVTDKDDLGIYMLESVGADSFAFLLVEQYETPGTAMKFVIDGTDAYVSDGYFGLQKIDFLNTDSIEIVDNFAPVCSSYVWAACRIGGGNSGQSYAVAYSPNYGETWTTVLEHAAWDFAFLGDTVYVATDDGLYYSDNYTDWEVIDGLYVGDPDQPVSYFPSGVFAVEVVGEDIWAGGADGAFRITPTDTTIYRSRVDKQTHFAYPTPFSPIASARQGATIFYEPPQTTTATIKIYDFNLDLVTTVLDNATRTGGVEYDNDRWDGRNDEGDLVANGVYFYNIKLGTGEDWWGKVAVIR